MIKPQRLYEGDTVAIVSLSSGLAGETDIRWRAEQGIRQIKETFNLNVKVMPHAFKGLDFIYNHPEKRAEDLNNALKDPEVKAIICSIGGNETIRIMPYIDFNALKKHPKIFSGYSDTTSNHFMFYNNGISTSYGPALLTDFAENIRMDDYTIESIKRTWFSTEPIGEIKPSDQIRQFGLRWNEENKNKERPLIKNTGYESINGAGVAEGHLIGGCFEVFANIRGLELFPDLNTFNDGILFLETAERHIAPDILEDNLRSLSVMDIFDRINGIIIGRPQSGVYYEEYKAAWQKILKEAGREDMPVLYNMSFGHNEPKFILPYGLHAKLDASQLTFEILESAVTD